MGFRPNVKNSTGPLLRLVTGIAVVLVLGIPAELFSQHRDERLTRIEPGMVISVRTNERIRVDREETGRDYQIYYGTVERDVRGDNGRLAIPQGSPVELIVRAEPDNDLNLDIDSVTVDGLRYGIRAHTHLEARRDQNDVIGQIMGAMTGAELRGRAIRVPAGAVLNFRIGEPLVMNVPDEGYRRGGHHYHRWRDEQYWNNGNH